MRLALPLATTTVSVWFVSLDKSLTTFFVKWGTDQQASLQTRKRERADITLFIT